MIPQKETIMMNEEETLPKTNPVLDATTPFETPAADALLELTAEEKQALEANPKTLVRAMTKKIFRSFKDEQRKIFEQYTKAVADTHNEFRRNTVYQMNVALEKADQKFGSMVKYIVHKVITKLEQRIYSVELHSKALMEETCFQLIKAGAAASTPEDLQKLMDSFQEGINARMEKINNELNEANKQAMAEQSKGQDSAATPQQEPRSEQAQAETSPA